jgi:hypothetical protein
MAAFGSKEVRMGFIRKVYSILSVQLVVTFGFVLIFSLTSGAKSFAANNPALVFVSMGAAIVSMLVLACCGEVRRQVCNKQTDQLLMTFGDRWHPFD